MRNINWHDKNKTSTQNMYHSVNIPFNQQTALSMSKGLPGCEVPSYFCPVCPANF